MVRILFICYGNICRSPMAEGVFRVRANGLDVETDSAGTSDWHQGTPPDQRAQAICAKHDIDISTQRARQICAEDFNDFGLILVMDRDNLAAVKALKPKGASAKIDLLLNYADNLAVDEVPDPYHDREEGFAKVLTMIEKAVDGLIQELKSEARRSAPH